jgi:putative peptidoglycan lipid II flippase
MGLVRDKVISYYHGASLEADLYFAAFVIPDFINYLLAGGYFSITLMPLLAGYLEKDPEDGWRFFSCVCLWIAITSGVLTFLGVVFAPHLAKIAAPGLEPAAWERLARFLRIILPAQVCFLVGSCLAAVLYLRKQFFIPALVPILYNGAIILGGATLHRLGMEGFCWGVLAGALLGNLLLPLWSLRQEGTARFLPCWSHPGLRRFFWLALPLMLGQSIVVLDEQLVRVFGSLTGVGAISWLNYARRVMLVPVGIVAQAAGVASYPFLADLVARKEWTRFHQTINVTLKNTTTLLIPLSFWMILVAEPTVMLVFQQGSFVGEDTAKTAALLRVFLAAVVCWGFQQIVGRAYYACQDTVTPVIVGTLSTMVSVPIFSLAARSFGALGVASASALAVTLYAAAISCWWAYRGGRQAFAGLGRAAAKIGGLTLAAGVPACAVTGGLTAVHWNNVYGGALLTIAGSGLCFVSSFTLLAAWLTPALVRPFLERAGPVGRWLLRP